MANTEQKLKPTAKILLITMARSSYLAADALGQLHLEYPAVVSQKAVYMRGTPVQPAILAAKVEAHIRQAMEAGWDPGSRGKPFVYEVEDSPG